MREREATEAASILGITRFEFWRQPDGALLATHQLVDRLRAKIEEWEFEILYVTHDREMLPDHREAARMVRRFLTDFQSCPIKPIVRMYEVWTPLQQLDEIIDISPYIEVKCSAIRAHKSQCDAVRFDEAALGLNRYRGELHSWPGGDFAEVFMRVKI